MTVCPSASETIGYRLLAPAFSSLCVSLRSNSTYAWVPLLTEHFS